MQNHHKDLRFYLASIQKQAPELCLKVKQKVDLHYEMTAVVKKLGARDRDPIVQFMRVSGTDHQIVSNLFASRKAIAMALDCQLEDMNATYLERLKNPIAPQIVNDGPVKEVVCVGKDVDLTSLPVPKHHEEDAGPYISAGVCIVQQPDGRTVNMGMYRFMISGSHEGGMFINPIHHGGELLRQAEMRNEPLEMAVVIGHHPTLAIVSQNNEPFGTDDYALAGGLLDEPLLLVPSETLSFPVPAMSEIVIEGELLPGARKDEGPFGEYTMYYGMKRKSPVFRAKAITHRHDYIFHDLIPSSREHLGLWVTPSKEANLYKKIKAVFPTLKEVRLPLNGCGYHAYVCIEKVRDGDGKNILLTLLGSEYMLKHAVVVDDDIDIHNDDEVLWAISTRVQADKDIFTVPGARSSVLDPSSYGIDSLFSGEGIVTKMGIDATKPVGLKFATKAKVPQDVWEKIKLEDFLGN
jgi:2,5-furandicarboxylate decarboxylase 1